MVKQNLIKDLEHIKDGENLFIDDRDLLAITNLLNLLI